MENQVEEIKKKLDIVNVINHFLPLKKRGRHHIACCPFHQEKTPSLVVSPELQIFKCFGCGKAGDIFTFVQEYERVDFREALEYLAKLAGIDLVRSSGFTQADNSQKILLDINTQVAKFYHHLLVSHPLGKLALDYVQKRGIKPDTINLFQIGYSPQDPNYLLKFLGQKSFKTPDLIATGTFGQSQYGSRSLYDRFQNRLVFPLTDHRGRILGFSGRLLPSQSLPAGRQAEAAKYVNSPETALYHKSQLVYGLHLTKEAIRRQKSVIVTEGEFDLISPFQSGIQNIVALKGTAFTPDQLNLLKRYTDTLILALDSDFAGNNAAQKSIETADSLGFDIHVLDLQDRFKDPDEAVQSDPVFFRQQLQNPIPVWDFIIRSAVKNYGVDTIRGKTQILSTTLPFIVKIQNSVIRSDYLKKLADNLGSDIDSILEEAGKYSPHLPAPKVSSIPGPPPPAPASPVEKIEEFLLVLIFGAKKPSALAQKLQKKLKIISTPRFISLLSYLASADDFNPSQFQQDLPPELQSAFQNLFLQATSFALESPVRRREIHKSLNQLNILAIKDKIKLLSRQISQNEDSHPDLEADYNRLLSDLKYFQNQKT